MVPLDDETVRAATALTRRYALRAADAIQLASALSGRARRARGGALTLVSSDLELNVAASAEHFIVRNPAVES